MVFQTWSCCSSNEEYKPLDKSLMDEMTAQYEADNLDDPLDLKGYTRAQIITLCVQTVPADFVNRKKLHKYFKLSKAQDDRLRLVLSLERNRADIYNLFYY